jgi:transcriptional antiterminator RfaH
LVRGVLSQVAEPFFPRDLFIQLDPTGSGKSWSVLRFTKGVTCLVTPGAEPAVVDDELIDALRTREGAAATQSLFAQGEHVRVISGSFSGIDAVYMVTDSKSRAQVLIELLKTPTRLRVDLRQIERLAN